MSGWEDGGPLDPPARGDADALYERVCETAVDGDCPGCAGPLREWHHAQWGAPWGVECAATGRDCYRESYDDIYERWAQDLADEAYERAAEAREDRE